MNGLFGNSWRLVGVAISILLIGVSAISIAHAYEHEPASVQDTACATCISISQFSAAAVGNDHVTIHPAFKPALSSDGVVVEQSAETYVPRERGPPALP